MATSRIISSPRLGSVPFGVWVHSLQHARNRDDMQRMVERLVTNGVDLLIPCIKQADGTVDYQCYCKFCQDKCRELTGADLLKEMGNFHPLAHVWYGYRAQNITGLVKRVSDKAHQAGKETSAAVFCTFPLSYNEQAQEWPLWLREGYLDVAMPMTYSTIPAETHYYTVNHVALHRDAGRGELWEGICSNGIDGELLTTISRNVVEAHAGGLVLFHYPDLTDAKFASVRAGLHRP